MHVAAFLPHPQLEHLRHVLQRAHALEFAADVAGLHAILRDRAVDVLIIDPAIRDGHFAGAIEDLVAAHRSIPVVLYTTLAPSAVRATMRLAKLGVQHVVFTRFDDEPHRFLELIERVPAHPMAELMLHELASPLGALPIVVARAVEQLFGSPQLVKNTDDLARLAGMAPRSLYRHLTPVGLQPRRLIVSARLLRAYTLLREPGSRLKEITAKLGYADPDTLSHLVQEWTGYTTKEVRRGVPPQQFVRLLAEQLLRADAGEDGSDDR